MGTINELFSLMKQKKTKHKCTFCGVNKPDAFWHGYAAEVYLCVNCAVDKIPKLIADAFIQYFGNNKSEIKREHITKIQLKLSEQFLIGIYAYGNRRMTELRGGIRSAQDVIDEALGKK